MQRELKEKVAARSFAKNYLSELNASAFAALEESGHFFDPVRREVSEVFIPWLMDGVVHEMESVASAHQLTDDLIRAALERAVQLQVLINYILLLLHVASYVHFIPSHAAHSKKQRRHMKQSSLD